MQYETITVHQKGENWDVSSLEVKVAGFMERAIKDPNYARQFLTGAMQQARTLYQQSEAQYKAWLQSGGAAKIHRSTREEISEEELRRLEESNDLNAIMAAIKSGCVKERVEITPEQLKDEMKRYRESSEGLEWLYNTLFPEEHLQS